MLDFSNDDLLRSQIVIPGWYLIELGEYEEKLSSAGDSTNMVFRDCKIIRNAEDGSDQFAGVPVFVRFNTKAKGFIVGFLRAFGIEPRSGERYDLSAFSGRQIIAFIGNSEYQGNMQNNVESKFKSA